MGEKKSDLSVWFLFFAAILIFILGVIVLIISWS